jgi:hypothetical protein
MEIVPIVSAVVAATARVDVTRADHDPIGELVPIAQTVPVVPVRKIVAAVAEALTRTEAPAAPEEQVHLVAKAEEIAMTAEVHATSAIAGRNPRPSRSWKDGSFSWFPNSQPLKESPSRSDPEPKPTHSSNSPA